MQNIIGSILYGCTVYSLFWKFSKVCFSEVFLFQRSHRSRLKCECFTPNLYLIVRMIALLLLTNIEFVTLALGRAICVLQAHVFERGSCILLKFPATSLLVKLADAHIDMFNLLYTHLTLSHLIFSSRYMMRSVS